MKANNFLLLGAFALGLTVASCNDKDNGADDMEIGKPASLTVTLVGEPAGRATNAVTQRQENAVKTFTVYVFDRVGAFEKQKTFSEGVTTGEINELVSGSKQIVVLANLTTYPQYVESVSTYSDVANTIINLDNQRPELLSQNGLVMSGEYSTRLGGGLNSIRINISRVASKITIGSVSVEIEEGSGHNAELFVLDSVYVMKAKSRAAVNPGVIQTTAPFYGGITGTVSEMPKAYLADTLTLGYNDASNKVYFYVFPNDDPDDNATLITFCGRYGGKRLYYPFRINEESIGSDDGTGEYIKRNTSHTINITFKKPGNGKTDPEIPMDPADLDAVVVPRNWTLIPEQNIEW